MRIDGKRIIAFSIDKDKDYSIHLADTENKIDDGYKTTTIEISPDKIGAISNLFSNSKYAFVGFGNKYHDNIIVNYILANKDTLVTVNTKFITEHIEQLLVDILEKQDEELEKKYKYVTLFNSMDLQVFLFSKDQKVSLEQFIKASDFKYTDTGHNVENIANILDINKPRIDARLKVEDIYNEDLFDAHEGVIGARLMKSLYMKHNNLKWNDIKNGGNHVRSISFKDIILPNIRFLRKENNEFLERLMDMTVTPEENWCEYFSMGVYVLSMNMAGLRLNTTPVKLMSDIDGEVYNVDVASFWPSIVCNYNIKPKQVNDTFIKDYKALWKRRLEFKTSDTDVSTTMKYMLNGVIGQFLIENSWLYDPEASLKIRLNGGLLMLMLAERLYDEFDIQCITIDGMFVRSKNPNMQRRLKEIVDEWSRESKLTADMTKYDFVYMLSNNDYIASDGTRKGFFMKQKNTGHSSTPSVIVNAVIDKLVNNTNTETFVRSCKDIGDFVFPVSSSKEKLEWMGYMFNTERMYASTDGPRVNKVVENPTGFGDPKLIPVTESSMCIADVMPDGMPDNINYRYYFSEANRILSKINENQLKLF